MRMKLKQKYTGGKVGRAKPRMIDVTGKPMYRASDASKSRHRNFLEGGIYEGQ